MQNIRNSCRSKCLWSE